MGAVLYRLRCVVRSRWSETVGLVAAVAVVSAAVLAFAAGAERTSTAPDRYTATYGGQFDAIVNQDRGPSRRTEVERLPGADSVSAITFVFGGLTRRGGGGDIEGATLTGSYLATGTRLVSGRDTNPANAGEFVASRDFVQENHVAVGDAFNLVTLPRSRRTRRASTLVTRPGRGFGRPSWASSTDRRNSTIRRRPPSSPPRCSGSATSASR